MDEVISLDTASPEIVSQASPVAKKDDVKLASNGRKRTRSGCQNCRRKRRKCDETKPRCQGCQNREEKCEWGVKVSWRPENAQTVSEEHPSMRKGAACGPSSGYQIVDVTSEVVRDYVVDVSELYPSNDSSDGTVKGHTRQVSIEDNAQLPLPSISTIHDIIEPTTTTIEDDAPLLFTSDTFTSPLLSESTSEDGIFLPGSQYHELHNILRTHIIDTARSTAVSRRVSPEPVDHAGVQQLDLNTPLEEDHSRLLVDLPLEQEHILWENWIFEVAPWIDKFDNSRQFELVLPILAKSRPHLKYSILATSARQMERKAHSTDNSCSLALYSHAIHLLVPCLQTRTTEVLASCVVLSVLEMMSCNPKSWKRHLDGCAGFIKALNISGSSGGLEQALFWVFARMDLCGAFITSDQTLIPIDSWMYGLDLISDIATFEQTFDSDMYANHMVYLCGHVVDLLCRSRRWEPRHHSTILFMDSQQYSAYWLALFQLIERWRERRPEAMEPMLTIPARSDNLSNPFPTVLYGNGPAVSGNQLYHTASLLMLKYQPHGLRLGVKPKSMLWHARQICAISISNSHHGCWTNSTQPLWIAGQLMSHPSEHRAILDIYARIERETGWATQWRADDLKELWQDDPGM